MIAGLGLLYLGNNQGSNVSSYKLDDSTITIIDLSDKNNDFNLSLIFGIILISLFLITKTYLLNLRTKPDIQDKLTKQEKRIVLIIKQGKTNKEIATELSISLSTAKTHINNIYKKLNINTRSELLKLVK